MRQRCLRTAVAFCLLAISARPTVGLGEEQLPRSVLILNQSTSIRPLPIAIIDGIRTTMDGKLPGAMSYYIEHVDLYRFNSSLYKNSLQGHLSVKYRDKPIGVIIAIGPGGLDLALELHGSLWPTAPVVFAAVATDTLVHKLPPGVTGTFIELKLANTIEVARAIVPNLRQIAIVGDRFEEQLYYRRFADQLPEFSRTVEFIELMGLPLREVRRRVAALPNSGVVYYIGTNSDPGATYTSAAAVLPSIVEVANRPIIVDSETLLGSGAVGGFMLRPYQIGQDAGRLALRILNGENPSDIPTTTGSNSKAIFDWRQLQRWGVSENRLPPQSEIRFREPSIWDLYRAQILVAFAAVLAQAAVISWLLSERRRRRVAEATTRETMSDLVHVNRMATAGELSASIAHEINQPLAGMVSNANAGIRWLAGATPDLGRVESSLKQIVAAGHHASEVIAGIRGLIKRGTEERAPVQINELIHNAIALERRDIERHHVLLTLDLDESLPDLIGDRVQLLQVILNLIRNAIEAMSPDRVQTLRIRSELDESRDILVSVEDSGTGIDQQNIGRVFEPLFTTKPQGLGIGLSICRSIIESHDGRLWVTSTVGRGSTFFIKLPRYMAGDG
ncbi:MAG TPA: ABC transporter substrate binding protein [Xanthobacteraceae bacterium]|nr:ABC transporter substrate binding protein [Xanthobacteraceae bacterium]